MERKLRLDDEPVVPEPAKVEPAPEEGHTGTIMGVDIASGPDSYGYMVVHNRGGQVLSSAAIRDREVHQFMGTVSQNLADIMARDRLRMSRGGQFRAPPIGDWHIPPPPPAPVPPEVLAARAAAERAAHRPRMHYTRMIGIIGSGTLMAAITVIGLAIWRFVKG